MSPKKNAHHQANADSQKARRDRKKTIADTPKKPVSVVPIKSSKHSQGKPATSDANDELWSPWLEVEAHSCISCKQSTHELDKDAPEDSPRYLKWVRKSCRGGVSVPGGKECYECYRTRDCSFGGRDFETLNGDREKLFAAMYADGLIQSQDFSDLPALEGESSDDNEQVESRSVDFLEWVDTMLDILLSYSDPSLVDKLTSFKHHLQFHKDVYMAMVIYRSNPTKIDNLKKVIDSLVELCQRHVSMEKHMKDTRLDQSSIFDSHTLDALFVKLTRCVDMDALLRQVLVEQFDESKKLEQLLSMLCYRKELLPRGVQQAVASGQTLLALFNTVDSLSNGKEVTFLSVCHVLRDVHTAQTTTPKVFSLKSVHSGITLVQGEFDRVLNTYIERLKVVQTVRDFLQKHGGITDASKKWDFDHLDFLKPNADPSKQNIENAKVEQIKGFVQQFPTWKSSLVKCKESMIWPESETFSKLKPMILDLDTIDELRTEVASVAAQVMVTSVVIDPLFGKDALNECIKHVSDAKSWNMPLNSLPLQLRLRALERLDGTHLLGQAQSQADIIEIASDISITSGTTASTKAAGGGKKLKQLAKPAKTS